MAISLRIGSLGMLSHRRISDDFDGMILATYGYRNRFIIPTD